MVSNNELPPLPPTNIGEDAGLQVDLFGNVHQVIIQSKYAAEQLTLDDLARDTKNKETWNK